MTSVAISHPLAAPQIMAANFLNLLIVDDERSIRDACREVAMSLGFTSHHREGRQQFSPRAHSRRERYRQKKWSRAPFTTPRPRHAAETWCGLIPLSFSL